MIAASKSSTPASIKKLKAGVDIEFNTQGPDSENWIQLPKTTIESSSINLHHYTSSSQPNERVFVRSRFQTEHGKQTQWVVSIPANETANITISSSLKKQKLKLIYFCNCRVSKLYPKIIKHHLQDLQKNTVVHGESFSAIFVVCGTSKDAQKIKRIAKKMLPNLSNNDNRGVDSFKKPKQNRLEIRLYESSHFEHQGIRTLWSESRISDDNDILVYAHCKHLSHIERTKQVSHFSKACSEIILRKLDTIHSLLTTFNSLERAGISQGGSGWMWHNFYAAKARYIKKNPEPLLTNRYYYEGWLGGYPDEKNFAEPPISKSKGLSMLTEHGIAIGHLSQPEDINRLIVNYKLNPIAA